MNGTYTYWAFHPVIPWLRDCHAWRECLEGSPDRDWAVGLWLLAQYLKAGVEPRRCSVIANLLREECRYG